MINVFGSKHSSSILEKLSNSINSGWIGCGPKVLEFEDLFSKKINKSFVMVNNGSNALHLAVKLLNLPPHSKIILPSFTFSGCINSILLENHIPVLCDVELDGNVSYQTISKVFTKDVKAIMVVHYAGLPVDVDSLKQFGVPIIEDAAHAVDSKINDIHCGSLGDVGVFSFDPIKNISTPDSGGISINDSLINKSKELRHLGISNTGYSSLKTNEWWEQEVTDIFPKYLPNDIAALFALEQLSILESNQLIRKNIWETYNKEFKSSKDVSQNIQHSYFTYLIRTNQRNDLAAFLKENGVYTTFRFSSLSKQKLYCQYANTDLTNSIKLNEEGLNIPLHPSLTENDVDKIINLIKLKVDKIF